MTRFLGIGVPGRRWLTGDRCRARGRRVLGQAMHVIGRWQMPRNVVVLVMLVAVLSIPVAGVMAQGTPVAGTEGKQPTAILVSAASVPMRVSGSDGMDHIEY